MESSALISASNYIQKRPFTMLKDYLLDDLSSCSSSGFKSFPRRQCCNTVRLLLEIDLNSSNPKPPQFKRSASSSSAAKSALQKASRAFCNAVKLLPFPSSSAARNKNSKGILRRLPRSISRKLFKNRKADPRGIGENRERKLFSEFLEEKEKPPQGELSTAGSFTCSGDSTISSSSKSVSWTESEFTGQSSFSESYRSRNGDGVGEKVVRIGGEEKTGDGASKTAGGELVGDSVENAKEWANEEEKEQLSPVSVLDCPFQDDDDEEDTNPPFQRSLLCSEGSKQKCVAKMIKFENVSGIKPVNLEHQIDQVAEAEDDLEKINSITKYMKEEKDANELLKLVKAKLPLKNHLLSKADSLLLDFFKEKIAEKNGSRTGMRIQFDEELETANKWLKGEVEEMFLGWEVKDKRHVYVREMERNGMWRNFDEDKQDVATDLELQIFTCLVNEALLDLQS